MFEHKGVRCVDCHMPKVPMVAGVETKMVHSHSWGVASTLPHSCGTTEGGCHSNHKHEWAVKQIAKGKIHGKKNH